jgi:uncharacterized protein YacL
MMRIVQYVLILSFTAGGYFIAFTILKENSGLASLGAASGLSLSILFILLEERIKKSPLRIILGGAIGSLVGLALANLFSYAFLFRHTEISTVDLLVYLLINLALGYLGLGIGMKKGEEYLPGGALQHVKSTAMGENPKILDTSVIIDGRIADICETGFIEGAIVIPQFILQELMHIADSPDPLRRTRGRRGLDVLNKIQKQVNLQVKIVDQDFPQIREVDSKLVALGKKLGGTIITNDFNLNKVAELQGVPVLNINQLATALKPTVLPGEIMNVLIQREGKEAGQGVAYLDDGTMVVVDNGKRCLGKTIDVSVTSVLQTTAGRMIFTVLKEDAQEGKYQSPPAGNVAN